MFGFLRKPSRERFARLLLDRIRSEGGPDGFRFDAGDFSLARGSHRIFLGHLYAEYCRLGGGERERMLGRAAALAKAGGEGDRPLDEVRPDLVAVVRERIVASLGEVNWGIEIKEGAKVSIANEPLSRWFMRALVVDSPSHMSYVSEENLRAWNLTFDEAFAIAAGNLRAATVPRFADEGGVHRGLWGDAYDSSRALLPGIFDDLPIEGEAVFCLPNRDTLLVADSLNPAAVRAMLERAERMVNEAPRAQNPAPLVMRDGRMEDYQAEPGSPAFSAVERARGLAVLGACEEQRAVLEKLYQRTGKDVYVGGLKLFRRDRPEGDTYRTCCVWARGVPTLLPAADEVAFHDGGAPEGERTVAQIPWARVRQLLGDAMLDARMYPPRYYVSTFPDAETLSRLRAG